MPSNPLRIIQIGTGATVHSLHIAQAIRQLPETYQHLGLVETDPEQKKAAEQKAAFQGLPFFSWEEAFALKPDAFFVETDELRLVQTAMRCLEAGFPVYMDKPGSGDADGFHRLCRLVESTGLPFAIGYMFRGNPAIRKALELVADGTIGRITSFEGDMSCWANSGYHQALKRFPGGMMYYLGCHLIDLMVQFCGFPEQIMPANSATAPFGVNCSDYGCCLFRYPQAFGIVKTTASEICGFKHRSLFLGGTQGAIRIQPLENLCADGTYTTELQLMRNDDPCHADTREILTFPPFRRYDTLLNDVADMMRGTRKNPYTPAYEAALHDLILAAQGNPPWQDVPPRQ